MKRKCDSCAKPYETKSKSSKFCKNVECRRERARRRKRSSRGQVVEFPADGGETPGVEKVTLAQLVRVSRVDTPAGQNALVLARRLDVAILDTGSSVAALSKQHLAALAEAVRDAPQAADGVDELKQRRERRRA